MTLLEAAESLGTVALAAISSIAIRPIGSQYAARFTIALLIPLRDPKLPEHLRTGPVRFWPDQRRLLESRLPMQDQITELHVSGIVGNLDAVHLKPNDTPELWVIETHAGSREERLAWMRSVIEIEGRSPLD